MPSLRLTSCLLISHFEIVQEAGKSKVDNASWDCFRGRKQKARPQKQSRDALSTSLLPGLLRNSEMANKLSIIYNMFTAETWLYIYDLTRIPQTKSQR